MNYRQAVVMQVKAEQKLTHALPSETNNLQGKIKVCKWI